VTEEGKISDDCSFVGCYLPVEYICRVTSDAYGCCISNTSLYNVGKEALTSLSPGSGEIVIQDRLIR